MIKLGDQVVTETEEVQQIIADSGIGEDLTLTVIRGDRALERTLKPEAAPGLTTAAEDSPAETNAPASDKPFIGVQMITLTPELAKENNQDPNAEQQLPEIDGVVVLGTVPGTPAEEAGLQQGDVIIRVDRQQITSGQQVQDIVAQSDVGQVLTFEVLREQQETTIEVTTTTFTKN